MQLESLRFQLINVFEALLNHPDQRDEAIQFLENLKRVHIESANQFQLNDLVFGWFATTVLSEMFQSDPDLLPNLIQLLKGEVPYHVTRAFHWNFAQSLSGDAAVIHQQVIRLFDQLTARLQDVATELEEPPDSNDDWLDWLDQLCSERLIPATVGELLVSHCCHILMSLPNTGNPEFDPIERFGGWGPDINKDTVHTHLDYVAGLLRKLRGEAILYIDIQLLREGYVLNLR